MRLLKISRADVGIGPYEKCKIRKIMQKRD